MIEKRDVRARLRSTGGRLLDQGMVSAGRFFLLIVLARLMPPAAYGAFTLLYVSLMLLLEAQNAAISRPHNVIGPQQAESSYNIYTWSTAVQALIFALAVWTVGTLTGVSLLVIDRPEWGILVFAFAPAAAVLLVHEFIRRVYYTENDVRMALAMDLTTYGGLSVAVLALGVRGTLDAVASFGVIAVFSLLGVLIGLTGMRTRRSSAIDTEAIKENWRMGRWLLAASTAQWGAGQLYVFFAALLIGLSATGALRAILNLVAPVQVLTAAYELALVPHAARSLASHGQAAFHDTIVATAKTVGAAVIASLALAMLVAGPVIALLYGDKYSAYQWLVYPYAVLYAIKYCSQTLGIGLTVLNRTRELFLANAVALVLMLTLGVLSIKLLGLVGVMVAVIGAESTVALLLLRAYVRRRRGGGP